MARPKGSTVAGGNTDAELATLIGDPSKTTVASLAGLVGVHWRTIGRALGGNYNVHPGETTEVGIAEACAKLNWPLEAVKRVLAGEDRWLNASRMSTAMQTSEKGLFSMLAAHQVPPVVLALREGKCFWSQRDVNLWRAGQHPRQLAPAPKPAPPVKREGLPIDADPVQLTGHQVLKV